MANRISQILSLWEPQKNQLEWVLGIVISTHGASYRKTGAMMMINSLGQWNGLLSGGCLESDLLKHARQVMHKNKPKIVTYDALDDETAWLLGIGCGGKVDILLQPVNQHNQFLQLEQLLSQLQHGKDCYYRLALEETLPCLNSMSTKLPNDFNTNQCHLDLFIATDPVLVIFGGGVDAIPLINISRELGWRTHLVDHRVTHARKADFYKVNKIIRETPEQLLNQLNSGDDLCWLTGCDAAVVMTHNLSQDADALNLLSNLTNKRLKYIGLLGPETRKQKVLMMANLDEALLPTLLHGPMGFNIGGELPESIALSILSEIHAVLEGKSLNIASQQISTSELNS